MPDPLQTPSVTCAACGTSATNPAARFCRRCGVSLELRCASCSMPNPPDAAFCEGCGARIEGGPSPVEERRTVTVVFADLSGFTSLAERLDPEDARAIADGALAAMASAVETHGGTVDKSLGDGLMAVFGAPIAHEDDPLRAARAALACRDAVRAVADRWGLDCSVGVNTGVALAGALTADAYTVVGDVVNVASRLQGAAPAGEVWVGADTATRLGDNAELEPLGPQQLRGKAEQVEAFRLVSVLSGSTRRLRRRDRTPFVGRARELALIVGAAQEAFAAQHPTFVLVSGPAGIGKGRVVAEATAALQQADPSISLVHTAASPYDTQMAYPLMVDILRQFCGLEPAATTEEVIAALDSGASPLAGQDASRIASRLAAILDPERAPELTSPSSLREELFWAVQRAVATLGRTRPTLIVIEDSHWAGATQTALAEHLARTLADTAVVVLMTTRTDLTATSSPLFGADWFVHLALAPLEPEFEAELVAATLGVREVPDDVRAAVHAASGGVPLYTEELVRNLASSGALHSDGTMARWSPVAAETAVPDTLEGLAAALLDGCTAPERSLLQVLAVWAEPVAPESLAAFVDLPAAALRVDIDRLRDAGLVHADAAGRMAFAQGVVREVAYAQLPRSRRAEMHLAIARHLDATAPRGPARDRATWHLERAVELQEASLSVTVDPGLAFEARRRLTAAGEQALQRAAWAEAAGAFRRSLALPSAPVTFGHPDVTNSGVTNSGAGAPADDPAACGTGDDPELVAFRALLGLGRALVLLGEADAAKDHLELAYFTVHDPSLRGLVAASLAEQAVAVGEMARSLHHAEVAEADLRAGDPEAVARAEAFLSHSRFLAGDTARAVELATRAAQRARLVGDTPAEAMALRTLTAATVFTSSSDATEVALAAGNRALELARALGDHQAIANTLESLAVAMLLAGRFAESHEYARQGADVARQFGLNHLDALCRAVLAMSPLASDDEAADAVAFAAQIDNPWVEGLARFGRAQRMSAAHDRIGAYAEGARAIGLLERAGDPARLAWALSAQAFCALHLCRSAEYAELRERAIGLASDAGEVRLLTLLQAQEAFASTVLAHIDPPPAPEGEWAQIPGDEWPPSLLRAEMALSVGNVAAATAALADISPLTDGMPYWTWDRSVRSRLRWYDGDGSATATLAALAGEAETPPLLAASMLVRAAAMARAEGDASAAADLERRARDVLAESAADVGIEGLRATP